MLVNQRVASPPTMNGPRAGPLQPAPNMIDLMAVRTPAGWAADGAASAQGGQRSAHRCGVEPVRGEVAGVIQAQPLQPVLVLWMIGIGHDLHKLGVAPDAAAVLRRGGA